MRWMLTAAMTATLALAGADRPAGAATMATDPARADAPVAMGVRGVGQYQGQWVVLLEDAAGMRRLPIWIGELEAGAIDLRIKKQKYPRPLTHDLLESLVAAAGARIERVEVVDLRDNVFYGRVSLRDAKGAVHQIDARPSDCIALAAGAGLPVWVAAHVLAAAAVSP